MNSLNTSSGTQRVLKLLGIFGGMQVILILCSVVRTKLAAVWIGPAGVGLMALYFTTMDMLAQTSQLNLSQSSVRDLALNRSNPAAGARTIGGVRTVLLTLGIGGCIAVILASPLISLWVFDDFKHIGAFCLLSIIMVFSSYSNAETSIMKGYGRIHNLTRTGICNAVFSVAVAIPLLYFFRIEAVAAVIALGYFFNAFFAYRYRVRDVKAIYPGIRASFKENKGMLSLGAYLSISLFVTLLAANTFIVYLNRNYGDTAVGIYQAGYTLVNTYVGIVFTALASEFYPRLSAARLPGRMGIIVSHEIKVLTLVLIPIVVTFICCARLCLSILYTSDFYAAEPFIVIGGAGVILRAASNVMAYTCLARSAGRVYIFLESFSAITYLALYIPLYNTWGYVGLGIGYVAWYLVYTVAAYSVMRYHLGIKIDPRIFRLIAAGNLAIILALVGYYSVGPWWTLAVMLPLSAAAAIRGLRR